MFYQKFQISAQYLKTTRIAVTILDVHNPAHFVVRESPTLDASTEAKHFIEAEGAMQKYYQSIEPGFFQLPLKDSVVVVLFKNKFYRAKVIRILNLSAGHLFKVYLVDYGIECSVERNCIYEIEKDFLVHPFQAVDFKLLGLEPISLIMDDVLNFSYGPVSSWDPSADTFVADIQKKICSAYIEVQAIDNEHIFGKLFICLNDNLTRCFNEELLSNKFARYNEDLAKKVQSIEKYLETGNIDVIEIPSTVEPISNTELNPKQISSTSEIEPDFFGCKMMFARASDGKIISQSCLADTTVEVEDNLFDQLMNPGFEKISDSEIQQKTLSPPKTAEKTSPSKRMNPGFEKISDSKFQQKTLSPPKTAEKTSPAKVSLESISPSSVSENPSETQNAITQKRLLKLRKSYENKLKASKHVENGSCAASENVSSAVRNTEITANANVCSNDAQLFTNQSPVKSDEKSNTISAKLNNTLINSNSSGLCDADGKSRVDAQNKAIESSPRQNETQESLIIHKRFLKLQQRCRKKSEPFSSHKDADPSIIQNPSCSSSKEEMKSPRDETQIKDNFKIMQEPNDFSEPIKNKESPISTNKTSKEEVNKSPTLESSENNYSTDLQNGNREQLIIHKRFLKLQKKCRKKCESSPSHKDADSSHIQNPPYSPSKEEIKSSRDEIEIKDDLKKMQEPKDFTKPINNPEPPISSINKTSREKVNKSPTLASFEKNYMSDNSSPSQRRRVTMNHKSNTSDSDDPFNSIYKGNENNSLDSVDLVESFIELSTQLQCSQKKCFVFNDKNFCGNQNVPVLQTGISSPICTLEEANFSEYLLEVLKDLKFTGPSCLQSVVWPAMARKQSIIMVSPPHSGKTIAYILPLISYLTSKSCYLSKKKGPFIIILCSSWVKAANVNDLLQLFLAGLKIKISSLCTHGGIYMNKVEPIVNNCDILIATPFCLLEFLKNNCISLERCEHFILDDGTALMNKDKKELKNIFVFLTDSVRESQNHPQIVLCARHWNKNFEIIKDKLMFSPAIFFTSSLESTVYAKIPIFAHVCKSTEKRAVLLDTLPKSGKVIVCTRNSLVAQAVHHFLRWEDVRCFLVHEDMEQCIADEVIKDWKAAKFMTSSHCLIVTDPILMKISINAADCLVHYDVPPDSRLQFENRFNCIFEHFNKPDRKPECLCHIFIEESEYRFAPQLVEIIENIGGTPSKELIDVAKNRNQDENSSGSLCHYLKAFGFCESLHCQNRHSVNANSDKPQMVPSEGDIQALVAYIIDPSHFYVRLLKYLDPISNKTISLATTYAQIGFKLKDFYKDASEEFVVKSPVVGDSYVLVEEHSNLFYRIKVLDVRTAPVTQLPVWKILYLDEGWVKFCNQPKLFKISDEINLPEPLAVEVYICKISPPDSCFNWNPQTTNLVKDLIGGKEICGKIALCMGKILWLDPIVLRVELANASEYVNLFKLNQRLLECGHVRLNKNHLRLLKKMCDDKIPLPQVTKAIIPKDESPKVETSINYAFLDCENYEDVYVSSVVSPQQFYVQRAKFVDCLDNLLDDINEQVENRKLKKAFTLQKGMPCIAPFSEDDRYYRAIITDIISCSEVQTFYVDFGDSGKVSRNDIYLLPSEFLLLPFQAIECELAGVAASHGGWTDSAANTLVTLARDEAGDMKILKLKAYSKTKCYDGGNHYVVDLWFNEKNLSEQLLQMGLGIPSNIPVVNSAEELDDNLDLSSLKTGDSYDKNCTSSDEDLDSDDKDMKALFFSTVENMIMKQYNLGPQPGATITEVSTDEEEILKTIKKPVLPTSEASEKLGKLFPKFKPITEDTSAEGLKGLKPLIIWWDTTEELNIQINLKDIKLYELDITDEGLYFNSVIANNQYTTTEKFYAEICSSGARTYQSREGINMVAEKKSPFKWPHLTKEKTKYLHIKYDLIHIQDSDAEEQDPAAKSNFPMPPYVAEENYTSTDDDEKYVPPWNEIGQNSNHYDLMS